jgi:uncharacterized protein (UPF0332 family)
MSFNWADFLTLADVLVRQRDTLAAEEACLRTAMSRAYYSAFGTACNFVTAKREFSLTRTGKDHRRLIDHFKNSPDRDRKQIGNWLDRVFDNRKRADYEDSIPDPLRLSFASLQQAQNILNGIRKLP